MNKILVTGATGPLGAATVESLLQTTTASYIAVLVRNKDKAAALQAKGVDIRLGDYDDYASLVTAFQGVDKLYLVSGNDIANRVQQQENAVNAAKEAGVKQVVYTSYQRKDETEASPIAPVAKAHLHTEKLLKASGLIYTILQHGLYSDMIPIFAGEQLLETNVIYQPAGDGKTAFALRKDLAEAGANILLDETGKYDQAVFELSGPEAVSYQDVAQIISNVTGQQISYYSPSVQEFTETMRKAGVPEEYISVFAGFATGIKLGEFSHVSNDLELLLGRKPVTAEQFLTSVYGKNL